MDPILNHYLTKFTTEHPSSTGVLIRESMDGLTVKKSQLLAGSYLVCSSTIKFHCEEQISLVGPFNSDNIAVEGGSLLAGRSVDLKSAKMAFVGTAEDPVTIIGLNGVFIESTSVMKIKNVVIYLLDGALFSFSSKGFESFENVRVMRMRLSDGTLEIRPLFDWPTYDEFHASL